MGGRKGGREKWCEWEEGRSGVFSVVDRWKGGVEWSGVGWSGVMMEGGGGEEGDSRDLRGWEHVR